MKRAREEEGEQEQQRAAPAPMAVSPARNPRPAAATPSGTSHRPVLSSQGQELTSDDAVDFVRSVKRAFNQEKYQEFLCVIRQFDSIGIRGVADCLKVLFRGHPELKSDLNMFLPTEYELSLRDDDD